MKRSEIFLGILRVPVDAIAVTGALVLAYWLRAANIDLVPGVQLLEPATTLPPFAEYVSTFVIPGVLLFVLVAALLRLYSLTVLPSAWSEAGRVLVASMLWIVAVMAWYFLLRRELFYSRFLLLYATAGIVVLSLACRAAMTLLQRWLLQRGIGVRSVVTVGCCEPPPASLRTLKEDPRYAYRGHIPTLEVLAERSKDDDIDLVIQTDAHRGEDTAALIDFCRSSHLGYGFLPPVLADVPHLLRVQRLGMLPLLSLQPTPLDGWGRVWKAGTDAVGSLILFIFLSPLLLLAAIAIVLEDGFPIFYISRRVGEHGRGSIPVLKFRSMVRDADARRQEILALNHRIDGPLFKVRDDPRVTRVGRFLRRWSIDELPQLLNVIVGQMALVGPRPHLPGEVERYSPYERRVFAVRPGLTGLAQVSGRSNLSFREEVDLDLRYIEEWSMWLDLWILWRTAVVVLGRRGAD